MKKLALAGAIAFALVASACTPEQRCKTGAFIYHQTKDRGGAAERAAADRGFAELRERCAAQGIVIN